MGRHLPSVGVIGAGPVARGLATLLHRAGHRVWMGTRHPEAARVHGVPDDIRIGSLRDAASGDVVIMAVRHRAASFVASMLSADLVGKVVVDTMNPWIFRDYLAAGLSCDLTEGAWMARQLPGARVTRAFSHIDTECLVSRAMAEPGRWAAGYAADDEAAADITERIIRATGYVPVHVGTLAESGPLDVGGVLWPYMFTAEDMRYTLDSAGAS